MRHIGCDEMIALFSGYSDGVGGMEIHRDVFWDYFKKIEKIILITRYPVITLSYDNSKVKFDNLTDMILFLKKLYPLTFFFNDGHWIYDYSIIRKCFPNVNMIMRSGGNEFLKASWHTGDTLRIRQKLWAETINNNLNFIIANSYYTRERMQYIGIKTGKIIVISGGVDLQKCLQLSKKRNMLRHIFDDNYGTKGKFLLVLVSRLVKFKGHIGFINALKKYNLENVNWHLVIVGDGPEKDNIYKLCKECFKVEQYTLLGSIKHNYALYITAIADCFVCPSIEENRVSGDEHYIHTETMGRSLIEAACLNVNIVASDAGAIPELVHENKQIIRLFDWQNPYRAIHYISIIADISKDKKTANKFDITACKKYDWKYIFLKLYIPLFKLIKKNKSRVCICFDIDGTIIQPFCSNKENNLNLESFLRLAKQGYDVIINSAGTYENIITWQPIIHKFFNDIILISDGGAKITAYGKRILFWDNYVERQRGITNAEIDLVCKMLTDNKVIYSNIKKIDSLYVNLKINRPISRSIEDEINEKIFSFGLFVVSNYNNLKILSINVNKGAAYSFCKSALLSSDVDFGFGDNVLDTLFVKKCKYKYYINYKGSDIRGDSNYITINDSKKWNEFLERIIIMIKGA